MIILLEDTTSPDGQEHAIELVVSIGDDFYRINYTIPLDADAQGWIDDHAAQIEADALDHGAPCDGAPYMARVDFGILADAAAAEIAWLDDTIPQIDSMTIEEVRGVVKRLAQENLRQIKAWLYVLRRLA